MARCTKYISVLAGAWPATGCLIPSQNYTVAMFVENRSSGAVGDAGFQAGIHVLEQQEPVQVIAHENVQNQE